MQYSVLEAGRQRAVDRADKLAFITPERNWTFAQFGEFINRIAQGLQSLGIGREDRVAILTKHTLECVALIAAAQRVGAVCMPVNWRLAPPEIAYILEHGDAKIFRNPGGRVTDQALEALVLGVHLLNVNRVLVVPHTRCAMASSTLEQVRERVGASAGQDVSWQSFGMVSDQRAALADDVHRVVSHPLIPDTVKVAGFIYDVDTGLLERQI